MIRFALEELAASRAADKLAVASGDLPADGDDVRSAFNGQAFEGVVVNVHLVGFGGNGALVAGVIDHEVGVAAQLNRSLAREQTEKLGGLGARGVHKTVQVQSAALDAI